MSRRHQIGARWVARERGQFDKDIPPTEERLARVKDACNPIDPNTLEHIRLTSRLVGSTMGTSFRTEPLW